MRYLVIQVGSGVLLLAGMIIHFKATGSLVLIFGKWECLARTSFFWPLA